MSTTSSVKSAVPRSLDASLLARVLDEGYGRGAWHGPDFKAALADVSPALATWRPAPGRHSIAEIALHHAYAIRGVRGKLSGTPLEPFVLAGDDWFALPSEPPLTWPEIVAVVTAEQRRLASVVADLGDSRVPPQQADAAPFDLVLGITCHAVYHAGQVQLIKRLRNS